MSSVWVGFVSGEIRCGIPAWVKIMEKHAAVLRDWGDLQRLVEIRKRCDLLHRGNIRCNSTEGARPAGDCECMQHKVPATKRESPASGGKAASRT